MVGEGKGQSLRAEAVANQLAKGMFIDVSWEFLQTLYKPHIKEHFVDQGDAEREGVPLDVIGNGVKSCFQLWRWPSKFARVPLEEFVPIVKNGWRKKFFPLEVRVTLALAPRSTAGSLEAGKTSPVMNQIKKVLGMVIGQGQNDRATSRDSPRAHPRWEHLRLEPGHAIGDKERAPPDIP